MKLGCIVIFFDKLKNRVSADGIFLGFLLVFYRVLRTIKSNFYGVLLGAKNLDIGMGCTLKGVKYMKFGTGVSIFRGMWLEAVTYHNGNRYIPKISIGNRACFSNNVHVSCIDSVLIGDDVLIGSNVHISDHNHGSYTSIDASSPDEAPALRKLVSSGPVVISEKVWIGDNVNIIGPAFIGAGAIIGSNSVVRGNIDAATIAVGSPARMIKKYNFVSGNWERQL